MDLPDPKRRQKGPRKAKRAAGLRGDTPFVLSEGLDLGDWDERDLIRLPRVSGLALVSLILAILSVGLLVLASLPALVLGVVAQNKIRASRGRLGGHGLAGAAVVIAAITTVLSVPVGIYLYEHWNDFGWMSWGGPFAP